MSAAASSATPATRCRGDALADLRAISVRQAHRPHRKVQTLHVHDLRSIRRPCHLAERRQIQLVLVGSVRTCENRALASTPIQDCVPSGDQAGSLAARWSIRRRRFDPSVSISTTPRSVPRRRDPSSDQSVTQKDPTPTEWLDEPSMARMNDRSPTRRPRAVPLAVTRRSTIRPRSSQEAPTIRSQRGVPFRRRSSLRSAAQRRSASWSHRRTRSSRHGHRRPCLGSCVRPRSLRAACYPIRRVGSTVSPAPSHRRSSRLKDRARHDRMRPAEGCTEQEARVVVRITRSLLLLPDVFVRRRTSSTLQSCGRHPHGSNIIPTSPSLPAREQPGTLHDVGTHGGSCAETAT